MYLRRNLLVGERPFADTPIVAFCPVQTLAKCTAHAVFALESGYRMYVPAAVA